MSAERLQLPEPAGTLWTRIREPLKRALGSRGAPTELKLGGWYGYSPKHKQYRAAFTEGSTRQTLEIWPNDPEPRGAERTAEVDGGNEIVLATAQILKGKLERGEDALARDVIDVITAERLDPASIEVAVNAITPLRTAHQRGLGQGKNHHCAAGRGRVRRRNRRPGNTGAEGG